MDLNQAIQKHAEWKYKLRNAAHSGTVLDAAIISTDNNCEFGKWLHGEARSAYGSQKSFPKCVAEHAAFHRAAGKVAVAANAKQKEQVEKLMGPGSEFAESSKKVAVAIIELQNDFRSLRPTGTEG